MTVLDKVTPGYNKARVKALYEMVETEMYLQFKYNPLEGKESDGTATEIVVKKNIEKLQEIVKVLEIMEPDQVFEEVLLAAAINLKRVLERIMEDIQHGNIDKESWSSGPWSLIELWKMKKRI